MPNQENRWLAYAIAGNWSSLAFTMPDYADLVEAAGIRKVGYGKIFKAVKDGQLERARNHTGGRRHSDKKTIFIMYDEFVAWLGEDPLQMMRDRFYGAVMLEGKTPCTYCEFPMPYNNRLCGNCGRPNKYFEHFKGVKPDLKEFQKYKNEVPKAS